ncbi:MAG TPA: tetratricopeptide repeat protein [Gemmatimonadales bacterium]
MSDDIRALTARLADEPSSLAFLELAEALRRRGQLDAAAKVARGGVSRYPGLADAHDLLARILSDMGDLAGAFDAWTSALQLDPMRAAALKGVGFLYFRAGDVIAALDHLQRAGQADPDDPSIPLAIARVRTDVRQQGAPRANGAPAPSAPPPRPPATPFEGIEGGEEGFLLVDGNGLRLSGSLRVPSGEEAGDRVAAQLAGVSREAARATRILGLGSWHSIAVESPEGHLYLAAPTADTVLLAACDHSLPVARVGLLAERAARSARAWLEGMG